MENEPITWELLCKLEPELKALLKEIKAVKDYKTRPSFCANAVWYGYSAEPYNFRWQLMGLVGWEARGEDPRLHTEEAYDLAYRKCYAALPNCRNCLCV